MNMILYINTYTFSPVILICCGLFTLESDINFGDNPVPQLSKQQSVDDGERKVGHANEAPLPGALRIHEAYKVCKGNRCWGLCLYHGCAIRYIS